VPNVLFRRGGLHAVRRVYGNWRRIPAVRQTIGWIYAIRASTGKTMWRYHAAAPVLSGVTVTAGGVALTGDSAGAFLVFDAKTVSF